MNKTIGVLTIAIVLACWCGTARANGLAITNVLVMTPAAGTTTASNTVDVQFDITWNNSWRGQVNYDAVWVFLKYSTDAGTTWNHATLGSSGTNPTNFSIGSGSALEIIVPTDKKGAFVQRSTYGKGTITTTGVQFVWNYGADSVANTATVLVKVIGIEMTYIPLGSFYLGDGNGASESFYAFHVSDNTSFLMDTSAKTVTCDTSASDDIDTTPISVDGDGGITGNALWPVGYNAFYLMKYGVTEGQWVEFFNTLTTAQKTTRDITSATGKVLDSTVSRNTVSWTSGDATTTRADRICCYLSWSDVAAYGDWAALRPITETEYEKACRGPNTAVYIEGAWGTATLGYGTTISGTENGTETITTSSANCYAASPVFTGGDGGTGPLRAGIFATSTSTRVQAGAGYYGNLDMTGTPSVRVASLGRSDNRNFTGSHGDGLLTTTTNYEGNATNLDWPGIDGTAARGITGTAGWRGGIYTEANLGNMGISNRERPSTTGIGRVAYIGGRLGRTANV